GERRLRRGCAVGRAEAGRPRRPAAEGGGEARLRSGAGAGIGERGQGTAAPCRIRDARRARRPSARPVKSLPFRGGSGRRFPFARSSTRQRRMGLTALDIVVLLLVGAGLVTGFLRGFVAELLSLGAWIAAIVALRYLHRPVSLWLEGPIGTVSG